MAILHARVKFHKSFEKPNFANWRSNYRWILAKQQPYEEYDIYIFLISPKSRCALNIIVI